MNKLRPWLAVVGSALVCVASLGALVAAGRSASSAADALGGGLRLYEARLSVADAQRQLGDSSVDDAIRGARRANATAEKLAVVIDRMADRLSETQSIAGSTSAATRRGVGDAGVIARQTMIAARLLAALNEHQTASTRYAAVNNRALRRILAALRETNESFPGP